MWVLGDLVLLGLSLQSGRDKCAYFCVGCHFMGDLFQNVINLFKKQKPTNIVGMANFVDYSKSYNLDREFKDEFYINLQKTITWTEKIIGEIENLSEIKYGKVLRTTNPIYEGAPFYKFYDAPHDDLASTPDIGFDYNKVLTDAMAFRQNAILPKKNVAEAGKNFKV